MKKIILIVIFSGFLTGCFSEPKQKYTTTIQESPSQNFNELNNASIETYNIETCEPSSKIIAYNVIRFTWSSSENDLIYTTDPDLFTWSSYSDKDKSLDFIDIYPVWNSTVEDHIHYFDPSYIPDYTFSPSGRKVLFWEAAYTRPTPTPDIGEVSFEEYEWLLDFFLITDENTSPKYINRIEGDVVNYYWANNENYVYLSFDQLQIPGEIFLVKLDLDDLTSEIILYRVAGKMYAPWFSLSPDEKSLAYQFKEDKNKVYILDLLSGETTQFSGLPDFNGLYWIDYKHWLLVKSSKEGSRFMVYGLQEEKILSEYFIEESVGEFIGVNSPILSPLQKTLFFNALNTETYHSTLISHSYCLDN